MGEAAEETNILSSSFSGFLHVLRVSFVYSGQRAAPLGTQLGRCAGKLPQVPNPATVTVVKLKGE